MSAAVCGKRPIFDDHYGTSCNVKKPRRGSSPLSVPGEAVSTVGDRNTSQDQDHLVLQLQDLFPNINRQVVLHHRFSCSEGVSDVRTVLPVCASNNVIGLRHAKTGITYTPLVASSQILQNGLVSCGYDLHSAMERFKTPYAESEARQCTQQGAVSIGGVPSTSQSCKHPFNFVLEPLTCSTCQATRI